MGTDGSQLYNRTVAPRGKDISERMRLGPSGSGRRKDVADQMKLGGTGAGPRRDLAAQMRVSSSGRTSMTGKMNKNRVPATSGKGRRHAGSRGVQGFGGHKRAKQPVDKNS